MVDEEQEIFTASSSIPQRIIDSDDTDDDIDSIATDVISFDEHLEGDDDGNDD